MLSDLAGARTQDPLPPKAERCSTKIFGIKLKTETKKASVFSCDLAGARTQAPLPPKAERCSTKIFGIN